MKIWVNGHEWAKQQARKAGIAFTALSNGFASCEDPALLQRICDALQPGTDQVFFQRWLAPAAVAARPTPTGRPGTGGSCQWPRSRSPAPSCSTQPRHARGVLRGPGYRQPGPGRPDTIEIIFDAAAIRVQQPHGGSSGPRSITRGTEATINAFYKHSRIKQYLKDGRALRMETVINAPGDLGCQPAPA